MIFRSLLTFFGLTSKHRSDIFSQIHEIVFYGKGGYSWHEVYSMPIWLRRFTFNKLKEWYEKQNKESTNEKVNTLQRPAVDPTYNIKAPKK